MARSMRHRTWIVPRAGFVAPEATISIGPVANASYIPSKWTFELDRDAVFERLVRDVYETPLSFLRELTQNALDATQCQMYRDLAETGLSCPATPTLCPEEWRGRYPVEISLDAKQIRNALSGEMETRHVLTVKYHGIGMDRDVIGRYFLQVGRSFYVTEQFRREYSFVPSSQFGVGFLSVFGASDYVTVETLAPRGSDGPIRLVLTGHKNYLLTERGNRARPGTSVEVVLRDRLAPGELSKAISSWCRRVEFPIIVNDLGTSSTIHAEQPSDFEYEKPDVTDPQASFFVKAFPIAKPGIEGEIFVFGRRDSTGENWAALNWARYHYEQRDPRASTPELVPSITCYQGIAVGEPGVPYDSFISIRVDFRGPRYRPTFSRTRMRQIRAIDPSLEQRCTEILREHLEQSPRATGDEGWMYKQRLIDVSSFLDFWDAQPQTIRIYRSGTVTLVSLDEIVSLQTFVSVLHVDELLGKNWRPYSGEPRTNVSSSLPRFDGDAAVIRAGDLQALSTKHHAALFRQRVVTSARWLPSGNLVLEWASAMGRESLRGDNHPTFVVDLVADPAWVGCEIHHTTSSTYGCVLLNAQNDLVQWLLRVKQAAAERKHGISSRQFDILLDLVDKPVRYNGYQLPALKRYLTQWEQLPGLPPELRLPDSAITSAQFDMPSDLRSPRDREGP